MAVGGVLRLPAAVITDLAAVRALVREQAEAAGLAADDVDDVVQAVDETVTNVLVHGYARRPGPLAVDVEHLEGGLVVRLRDEAPPFDPQAWERPDADAPWTARRPGGFGISLTRGCVDEIYHRVRDDTVKPGNEITLVKRGSAVRESSHEHHP